MGIYDFDEVEEQTPQQRKKKDESKLLKQRQYRCDDALYKEFKKYVEKDKTVYSIADCIRVMMRRYVNSARSKESQRKAEARKAEAAKID